MRVSTVVLGVLVACVSALAVEHGPLLAALHPKLSLEEKPSVYLVTPQGNHREKRSLLLGAGLLGAGAIGAGAIGAGVLGAGLLGAGVLGAKAGFIGGALAGSALGRSYGGYGGYYGGGYGGYYGHGYGGHGGYRSYYYPSRYYVSSW